MSKQKFRVGLIVPSSNTTMETEIPEMLRRRCESIQDAEFTFHSSRMRMLHVTKEELKKMDSDSERCAVELADARCDVLAYACLIAIMSQGNNYHLESEKKLCEVIGKSNLLSPVISSAGALISGIKALNAKKVAIITPYMKPLTKMVIEYLEESGIEVTDSISLEVSDNLAVGRLDPMNLVNIVDGLDITQADAVVLSACVQMPSLPAIQIVEDKIGKPVLSAATATTFEILKSLDLNPYVPNAGRLLSAEVLTQKMN